MEYSDLFKQYGTHTESTEHRIWIHVKTPESMKAAKDIDYYDRCTAQTIAQLERYAELLRQYRIDLAKRYAQLETMAYTDALSLERCPHWKGHIEYVVTITRTMEDGTKTEPLREVFSGKDRRKAFARYEELRKLHPGIKCHKDIERRNWER